MLSVENSKDLLPIFTYSLFRYDAAHDLGHCQRFFFMMQLMIWVIAKETEGFLAHLSFCIIGSYGSVDSEDTAGL